MRYILEVYVRLNHNIYYFYPSSYGNIMTDDPWKAIGYGFKTIEGAEKFFNEEQESFKELFKECDVLAVKIVGVRCSMENACMLVPYKENFEEKNHE